MEIGQQRLQKDNSKLRAKLEKLERENRGLKKSVYDLSVSSGQLAARKGWGAGSVYAVQDLLSVELRDDGAEAAPEETMDGEGGLYALKATLSGHSGAVYAAAFSPSGRLLATGSLDKTVRVWDASSQREVALFLEHRLPVSDVHWSPEGAELASSSLDHAVRLWDVASASCLSSWRAPDAGFVQCVRFAGQELFAGTSQKHLLHIDRRVPNAPVASWRHDAMVNSVQPLQDGVLVLSADAVGTLRLWDVRVGAVVDQWDNDEAHHAVSHVSMYESRVDDNLAILATSSYDSVLRIHHRSHWTTVAEGDPPIAGAATESSHGKTRYRLSRSLIGHRSNNFPIRHALFVGKAYDARWAKQEVSRMDTSTDESAHHRGEGDSPEPMPARRRSSAAHTRPVPLAPESACLAASGSLDGHIYIYDVDSGSLIQRLRGHKGRVYAVSFHSSDPLLVSGSADSSVRLWSIQSNRR